MPAASPKPWLSLDTGIAVRLGERMEIAHLFRELAQERGFRLLLVPTALAELEHHSRHASSKLQDAARHFLDQRKIWGIQCALADKPGSKQQIEWLAAKLRSKGYIPELERRDSLIRVLLVDLVRTPQSSPGWFRSRGWTATRGSVA